MTNIRKITATAALTAGAVALAMLPAGGASAKGQDQLAEVRQATKQFHDVQAALDAGYVAPPDGHCVPGMGFHYVNPPLMEDPAVDALRPEVLLYAPSGDGDLRLVAVEWFRYATPGVAQETIRVVGETLHGPMTHGLPRHYDLHAYIWQGNPDGVFHTTNRSITCAH